VLKSGYGKFIAIVSISSLALAGSPVHASKQQSKIVLTVFAASSLSETFTEIGRIFHRKNPGISIKFSFLASSVLASQLVEGAPADVFAAASQKDMAAAGSSVLSSRVFATNKVVLVYPSRNANLVTSFEDLNKPEVKWIQCASSVACGAVTNSALSQLGRVRSKPVSYEPKVASVVSKLLEGEVDAAFIYHTDFVSNRKLLREVPFPNEINSSTKFPIALVASGKHKAESRKFINEVLSGSGQKILKTAGFGKSS
jgi:molybdate transport system substrate-binding protein